MGFDASVAEFPKTLSEIIGGSNFHSMWEIILAYGSLF